MKAPRNLEARKLRLREVLEHKEEDDLVKLIIKHSGLLKDEVLVLFPDQAAKLEAAIDSIILKNVELEDSDYTMQDSKLPLTDEDAKRVKQIEDHKKQLEEERKKAKEDVLQSSIAASGTNLTLDEVQKAMADLAATEDFDEDEDEVEDEEEEE